MFLVHLGPPAFSSAYHDHSCAHFSRLLRVSPWFPHSTDASGSVTGAVPGAGAAPADGAKKKNRLWALDCSNILLITRPWTWVAPLYKVYLKNYSENWKLAHHILRGGCSNYVSILYNSTVMCLPTLHWFWGQTLEKIRGHNSSMTWVWQIHPK